MYTDYIQEYASNMTHLKNCVNPRPHQVNCALDRNIPTKVVKFRYVNMYHIIFHILYIIYHISCTIHQAPIPYLI